MDFGRPNVEIGQKMAIGHCPTIISSTAPEVILTNSQSNLDPYFVTLTITQCIDN